MLRGPASDEPGRWQGVLFASAVTAVGLLLFAYRYLDAVATGSHRRWLDALACELTGAWASGVLFLGVRKVARGFRLDQPGGWRHLPVHAGALLLYAFSATSLMWGSRLVLFPLLGLGPYDYGRMPHRYLMELPLQVIGYALMVGGVLAVDRAREGRARVLQLARLESQLTRAQLENLELQLQPHFLFNTLNTIGSAMYDDPAGADEMLGHLAALLRFSLRTREGHEVTLQEELEALDHYLDLMRARFGAGLKVDVDVDEAALGARVPPLLLQPLVENAVRHGTTAAVAEGTIAVRARVDGDRVRLEVRDHGPGPRPPASPGTGLGLGVTRERLRLLHPGAHTFEAGAEGTDGFAVVITLPFARPGEAVPA